MVSARDNLSTPNIDEELTTSYPLLAGPTQSSVPQFVNFRVNNNQSGRIDKWTLIISVSNPVMIINPMQSVKSILVPK